MLPSAPPVLELQAFLEDYKSFVNSLESKRIAADTLSYTRLLSGWQMLQHLAAKHQRTQAPDYNIFWLLKNLYRDETRLHSPFLADLLNPNGTHQQGILFYEALLELLRGRSLPVEQYQVRDPYFVQVATEVATGNLTGDGDGYIDILLTYQAPERSFAIAIENKIYAGDQHKQLERYQAYLQLHFTNQHLLLYLTPQPDCVPAEHSIKAVRRAELEAVGQLGCISYKNEINSVLTRALPHVEAPTVRAIIMQYQQVITAL
ncbi:PD-(D/E)XK nuclease family protein [Hymenobacter sp. YC55]|uniref:PDDEXK-like family protein n=1 Tax=Hymenobacter sp. YC55 TaxID=3034019 RepID=UPI0023F6F479|nr:PD-(D/E)XK nuclease family protein [Hymenobacter sp. YC55]MDF7810916.1 PD-(D/E)XK nuclease family protein [Hymenobacter sp. YC55]